MSLSATAPMDREIECIIIDAAVSKTRSFTRHSLDHMPDDHVRQLLDECVEKAREEDTELWWEDDRAYGIMPNTVIRVDQVFEGADRQFYAVLRPAFRPNFKGQMIMVTVVDEAEKKIAIRGSRWLTKKPTEPMAGSLQYKALEGVKNHPLMNVEVEEVEEMDESGVNESGVNEVTDESDNQMPYLIRAGDYEYKTVTLEKAQKKVMDLLLIDGHSLKEVSIYKRVPFSVNVILGEGGES